MVFTHALALFRRNRHHYELFSKLDANIEFWKILLAKKSQQLTTFITPFCHYHFKKMPYRISSTPEHFQKKMTTILSGLDSVLCLMDDVLVFGQDERQQNERLTNVLERIQSAGVTLNQRKMRDREETAEIPRMHRRCGRNQSRPRESVGNSGNENSDKHQRTANCDVSPCILRFRLRLSRFNYTISRTFQGNTCIQQIRCPEHPQPTRNMMRHSRKRQKHSWRSVLSTFQSPKGDYYSTRKLRMTTTSVAQSGSTAKKDGQKRRT